MDEPRGVPFVDARFNIWVEICATCGSEAHGISERAVRGFSATVHLPPPPLTLRFEYNEQTGLRRAGRYAVRSDNGVFVVGVQTAGRYSRLGEPHATLCGAVLAAVQHSQDSGGKATSAA